MGQEEFEILRNLCQEAFKLDKEEDYKKAKAIIDEIRKTKYSPEIYHRLALLSDLLQEKRIFYHEFNDTLPPIPLEDYKNIEASFQPKKLAIMNTIGSISIYQSDNNKIQARGIYKKISETRSALGIEEFNGLLLLPKNTFNIININSGRLSSKIPFEGEISILNGEIELDLKDPIVLLLKDPMPAVSIFVNGMYQEKTENNIFYYPAGMSLENATRLKEHLDLEVIKGKIRVEYKPN